MKNKLDIFKIGVATKPCQIKTLPIDFQEVEIYIKVKIDEGEDTSNKTLIDSIILYKTFPFSFMFGDTTIYGDFFICEHNVNNEGLSPLWYGVILYNLNSFHVNMEMTITSQDEREIYNYKLEFGESDFSTAKICRSKINKEKLPDNKTNAIVGMAGFLHETLINSHSTVP